MTRGQGAIVAVLLLAIPAGTVAIGMRGTPNGAPDIAGTWTGTLKGKGFDQTGLFLNASFKDLVTLSVTQAGSTIGITVTGDQTLEGVSLTGEIGNRTFWVSGVRAGSGLPTVLSGHVNVTGTAMKAVGVTLSADPLLYEVVELKLSAKKIL